MVDILPLLDELRTIAANGLHFARDPYDRERYERLMALVSRSYGAALDLPPAEVRRRLAADVGYVTPKVGADAAIFDGEGRILLMLRADDERWCLPCGWVDPNEGPAEAAVRETYEETGLRVRVVRLVDVIVRRPSAENGPHTIVSVVYLCEVIDGEPRCSHEGLDLRYWAIDEAPAWHRDHRRYAEAARAAWSASASGRAR